MRNGFTSSPKHTTTRQQSAHDHAAPLKSRKFGFVHGPHDLTGSRVNGQSNGNEKYEQQSRLPSPTKDGHSGTKPSPNGFRQRVQINEGPNAENERKATREAKQWSVELPRHNYLEARASLLFGK